MDDTPETIRHEMDETKSQLNEKLESLELQVAESIESTGTAMNATVESVQETVETVSEAVQDAVHSVSHAFDLRRQFEKHPWWILGGAAVLGYLAVGVFKERARVSDGASQPTSAPHGPSDAAIQHAEESTVESKSTAISSPSQPGGASSSGQQLTDVAFGVLIGILQDIASRATPGIVDMLTGASATPAAQVKSPLDGKKNEPNRAESTKTTQRLRIASSRIGRSDNSF